jgi:hypothetical protein
MSKESEIKNVIELVQNGTLSYDDAVSDIMDIFNASKKTALIGALQDGDILNEYGEGHRRDAERIRDILVKKGFINAGLNDAIGLWGEYSDSYCAGWLGLDEDDEDVYNSIKRYIVTTNYFD